MAEYKSQNKIYEKKIEKRLMKLIQSIGMTQEQAKIVLEKNQQIKNDKQSKKKDHISGYNLFAHEVFETEKEQFRKNTREENWAIIGHLWKNLGETEKEDYNNRAVNIKPKPKNNSNARINNTVNKKLKQIYK